MTLGLLDELAAMVFLSSGGRSLDASFPVPLKSIDSEDDDLDFPRLIDLPYDADSDKLLIKLLNCPRGDSFLEVSASETLAKVKEQVIHSVKVRGAPLMLNWVL